MVVVLRDHAWKVRTIRTGRIETCDSFLEFLTAPPLHGLGEDPARVEALLRDDAEALTRFREAITPPHGGKREKGQTSKSDNRTLAAKRGTTRAYTLDRLKRTDPALYAAVVAGELSANAAAVRAGFRQRKTPLDHLRHWWDKASPADRAAFLVECSECSESTA